MSGNSIPLVIGLLLGAYLLIAFWKQVLAFLAVGVSAVFVVGLVDVVAQLSSR